MLGAVILDFDGTLVDSEMPIYLASAGALAEMGLRLTVPGWAMVVGHGEDDSHEAMCAAVGARFDRTEFEARYASADPSWRDSLPLLPGIERLLDELAAAAVPCGIASSSSSSWVEGHLVRLGIREHFAVIASRDQVGGRSKPDPASYRFATEALGAGPERTVAIEDSRPGITAARAAGLAVVAIPSEITQHTDLSAADLTLASVQDLTVVHLTELAARRDGHAPERPPGPGAC